MIYLNIHGTGRRDFSVPDPDVLFGSKLPMNFRILGIADDFNYDSYLISKKSWPIWNSNLLYKKGQEFLDMKKKLTIENYILV